MEFSAYVYKFYSRFRFRCRRPDLCLSLPSSERFYLRSRTLACFTSECQISNEFSEAPKLRGGNIDETFVHTHTATGREVFMKRLLPAIEGVFWEFSSDLFLSFPSLTSSAFRERCEHDSCSRGCEGKAIARSSAWAKDWALST